MPKPRRPPVRHWEDLTVVGVIVGSRLRFVEGYVAQHLSSGVLPPDVEVVSVNRRWFPKEEEGTYSLDVKVR